ncbi:hypothetical protein PIB30_053244 [Stylosanthes scabra]|uniref:Uncharacterized protein n=1 Tax=Stylosanthes scabra TaxID=79078 RepID=A0ABU6XIP3_9FABA|nr:hypothetical protein [Stylosanthes scabra]
MSYLSSFLSSDTPDVELRTVAEARHPLSLCATMTAANYNSGTIGRGGDEDRASSMNGGGGGVDLRGSDGATPRFTQISSPILPVFVNWPGYSTSIRFVPTPCHDLC